MTGIEINTSQDNKDYKSYLGVNAGLSKLALSYRAGALLMWPEEGEALDQQVEKLSDLACRVDALEKRRLSLSSKFRRVAEKAVSFTAENSVIFGAAIAGSVVDGPTTGIMCTTLTTARQAKGSAFLRELDKAGYDICDPEQVHAALNDQEFMVVANKRSWNHMFHMSGAVAGAGFLAGALYKAFAEPVASVGTKVASSAFPRLLGEFAEKASRFIGEGSAALVKSGVNSATRKALSSQRARAIVLSAAMSGSLLATQAAEEQSRGFPNYNTSRLYL